MILPDFELAKKKGEMGEEIVREWLEARGWIVYGPKTKNKAHYFDQLATKDKQKVVAIDVKTKSRLNKWAATGINRRHYNEYMRFCEKVNVKFYLVFVDDKNGDVHCQELRELKKGFSPSPRIIAWHLKDMIFLFNIGEEAVAKLSALDQRNHEYQPAETNHDKGDCRKV